MSMSLALQTSLRHLLIAFKRGGHRLAGRTLVSLLQQAKPGLEAETAQKILIGKAPLSGPDLICVVSSINNWAAEAGLSARVSVQGLKDGTALPAPTPLPARAALPPRPVLSHPNETRKVGAKLHPANARRPSRLKPKVVPKDVPAVAMAVTPPARVNNINTQTEPQTERKPDPEYDALVDEVAGLFSRLGTKRMKALLHARKLLQQAGLPALAGRDHELVSTILLGGEA